MPTNEGRRKRTHCDTSARFLRLPECAERYNLGMNTMRKLGREANAIFCATPGSVGVKLYDTKKIDEYIEKRISQGE